jgi:hypothetical protein
MTCAAGGGCTAAGDAQRLCSCPCAACDAVALASLSGTKVRKYTAALRIVMQKLAGQSV